MSDAERNTGSWHRCVENHTHQTAISVYNYGFGCLSFLECALIVLIMVIYLKARMVNHLKVPRTTYLAGLLLFLCSFAQLLSCGIMQMSLCHNYALYDLFYSLQVQLYAADYFLLIALLFNNLSYIFKETPMELSCTTRRVFWSIYILTIFVGGTAAVSYSKLYSHSKTLVIGLFAVTALMFISLIVALVYAFVYKLRMVYSNNAQQSDLKTLITKSSMLALISLGISILSMVVSGVNVVIEDEIVVWFLTTWLIPIDTWSNAVCIFFQYQHFSPLYKQVCGKCDIGWHVLCDKCTNGHLDDPQMLERYASKQGIEITMKSRSMSSISRTRAMSSTATKSNGRELSSDAECIGNGVATPTSP